MKGERVHIAVYQQQDDDLWRWKATLSRGRDPVVVLEGTTADDEKAAWKLALRQVGERIG